MDNKPIHTRKSPCIGCSSEFEDKDQCSQGCQAVADFNARMDGRPAVNLAKKRQRDQAEMAAIIAGSSPQQLAAIRNRKVGPRAPRLAWTDSMMALAVKCRRQGLSLEATAAIVGVGRKYLSKRLKEEVP